MRSQTRAWSLVTRSLRAKLQLGAVLLVVLPGLLVSLVTVARARLTLEGSVGRQLAEVAHDVLDELAGAVADAGQTLRTSARQDVMRDLLVGDIDKRVARFLRSVIDGGAPFLDLTCIDRQGLVVATTSPLLLGRSLADAPGVADALGGREWVGGPSGGDPAAIEIVTPIPHPDGSGGVVGVLRGRYDWSAAIARAARIRNTLLPHGLTVDLVILDRQGAIIGESWSDVARASLRDLASAVRRGLEPGHERGWAAHPEAGALVGWDRADRAQLGWTAVVLEPLDEAYAPITAMQRWLGLVFVGVVAGALALATYVAERMSRPLRALTDATREIAHGDTTGPPVPVVSRDEIGELAEAFNGMKAALRRAHDDLLTAAKFAFVGEVAAGIAHEVRTPLGILRSSAQLLVRSLRADTPRAGELASMMIEEVDRLDRVVEGLLELARPHEPVIEPTPLEAVLGRAIDFAEGQAAERRVTLRREFAAGLGPARCDPDQLYQVALNLVVNALQILSPGGTITVRTLACGGDRVAFEVQDDGPGIPAELHDRLFTPFFSRRPGGTGLGLALVQRVVQAHQGTVSVTSEPGHGATFRVELPLARTTA